MSHGGRTYNTTLECEARTEGQLRAILHDAGLGWLTSNINIGGTLGYMITIVSIRTDDFDMLKLIFADRGMYYREYSTS
jgi:hypothetical protein